MFRTSLPAKLATRALVCALGVSLASCTLQTEDLPPGAPFEGELALGTQALYAPPRTDPYSNRSVTIYSTKDATLSWRTPTTARGSDPRLTALNALPSFTERLRGLLEFDLSTLAGADIKRATLTLTADPSAPLSGQNAAVLRRVTAAWDEATVTWNTQPSTTTTDEVYFGPSTGTSVTVDVTKLVTIMARPGLNHGLLVQLLPESQVGKVSFLSSDGASDGRQPELVVEYTPRCGQTSTLFCDTAFIGTNACSEKDYATIDNCYNSCNPPTPTTLRPTSQFLRNVADNVITIDPNYAQDDAAPGASAVLPFLRSTNDGRLFMSGGCKGCGDQLNLQVFRPENLTHDFKQAGTLPPTPTLTNRAQWHSGFRGVVHPFFFHNPVTSLHSHVTTWNDLPDALQSTICDASGADVSDTVADAVAGIPSKAGRNPVACQAHYETSGDATPANDIQGDCYDITLLHATSGIHVLQPGEEARNLRWELVSSDVTVFVPKPKRGDTAATNQLWIYPRNPEGEDRTVTPRRMPAYRPFNPHDTTFARLAAATDYRGLFTTDPEFKCYTSANPPVRNPNGPKWCQLFDRQHQANVFTVDRNRNTNLNDGTTWDGTTCGHAFSGPNCSNSTFLFESVTTGDGKLLVANVDGVGIYYSYNTKGACRADGWTKFLPISFMPMDPNIYENYDLGRTQRKNGTPYPFRDSMGNEIPFGELNTGAYPWIDRAGKNLFYAESNRPRDGYFARSFVTKDGKSEVPLALPPVSDADRFKMNPDRGAGGRHVVLGAWTQGKVVGLDGTGPNISDLTGNDDRTYQMRLYSGPDYAINPRGVTALLSFENQLNYLDAMRPTQPFDVVWTVQSNNQRNSEVVFDEYLRNDAFVVAHMNAPTQMSTPTNVGSTFVKDGFVATYPNADVRYDKKADFRFRENPLLQNSATSSTRYSSTAVTPPRALRVRGGARIEPVGLGGVIGKGLYFDGLNDFVDMGYQSDPSRKNWYLGVWLENQDESTQGIPRTIFHFADNSWVGIEQADLWGKRNFTLVAYDGVLGTTQRLSLGTIVQTRKYFHFGLKLRADGYTRLLDFYIDGTPVGGLDFSDPTRLAYGFNVMTSVPGQWTWMTLGDPGPAFVPGQARASFRGWLDELRIYALSSADITSPWTEEFICNTALGTLVDLTIRSGETSHPRLTALRTQAAGYPGAPSVLCEQMKLGTYSTPNDFPDQRDQGLCIDRVHKNPRTSASLAERCLRSQRLDIAVRQLSAARVRPSFSDVRFCQSCHHDQARIVGLLPGALSQGVVERWLDPRRQPLDRPATLSGVFPSWLNTGLDLEDKTRTLDHLLDPGRAVSQ